MSDGEVLPVMTDFLAVPECLVLSRLVFVFSLSCLVFYVWSVSINHPIIPAQDVPAANMAWSVPLRLANAEVPHAQILPTSLTTIVVMIRDVDIIWAYEKPKSTFNV